MRVYGDESGHLRNVLEGDEEVFVVGLVAGERFECQGPATRLTKGTRRSEARWSELTNPEKSDFIDHLDDRSENLQIAYAAPSQREFNELARGWRLYRDTKIEGYDWDLYVQGVLYAAVLEEMFDGRAPDTYIDRLYARQQWEAMTEIIEAHKDSVEVDGSDSQQYAGIQTADCVAGAVRDRKLERQDFLSDFDGDIIDATDSAAQYLETQLQRLD